MLTQMADAEALLTQEQQRSAAQTYFYASLNGVAMDRLLQTLAAQSNVTIASIYLPFAAQPQAVVPFGQAPITVAAENGTAEENPAAGPIALRSRKGRFPAGWMDGADCGAPRSPECSGCQRPAPVVEIAR